jgi:hypothetical protein
MPIKRLIQQAASFPIIGKLRKGDKKGGNQPGKDLDYFRFDTDDVDAMQKFSAKYGPKPKAITVYLPFRTIEENFTCWQEEYTAGGLKHRCDGDTCVIWQDEQGRYHHEPKPCPGGCKEVGRLTVVIPELMRFAYVSVETHSLNDIMQLQRNLNAAFALRGDLTGIPFLLIRRLVEISTPSGTAGKRARRAKALLFLEPHPDWVQVRLLEMRRDAVGKSQTKQLADGRVVDSGTGEIEYVDEDEDDEQSDNPFTDPTAGATPFGDRLMGKVALLFNNKATEAAAWLVEGYTRKYTPDNIRKTVDKLSADECDQIADSLSRNGEAIKAKFAENEKLQPTGK